MDFGSSLGRLVLRLMLGGLLLFHGVSKIHGGIAPIVDRVAKAGVPSSLGYFVYVGEVLAPVLLIVGLWTRLAALLVMINMIVALLLVHTSQLAEINKAGGWALELQAFYLFTALAILLLGAGRFSVGGAGGKLN